jgi:DNA-binding transcriptional regulator YdaS (Cro superfamily)
MDLHAYLKPLSATEVEAFALAVGTTVGHLNNVRYRQRRASAALAKQITIATGGQVPLSELRPEDWRLIWPEAVAHANNCACERP